VLPYFIFGLSALPALPYKVSLPGVTLKKELEGKQYAETEPEPKLQPI
jgi:hypothetical protein